MPIPSPWRLWSSASRFLSLLLGELVPKQLALRQAERLAQIVAPVLHWISIAFRPFVWLMGRASDAVLILLRAHKPQDTSVSLDDIEHMIETGTEEGVLESVEQRVAMEALRLGERTVRDVMRPRIDLDALDVNTPAEEVIGAVAMAGFSRVPVYEGDLDHILGFVHIKDLFRQIYLGWPIELRKLLKPALFVPESMPLGPPAAIVSGAAQPIGRGARRIRRHRRNGHAGKRDR